MGGTWTANTWTSAGETWTDAPGDWAGESSETIHIHAGNGQEHYLCYDIDVEDHLAHCTGTATDTSATPDCTNVAAFTEAADTRTADNCPAGCVFTAAPRMARVVVPHAPSVDIVGYNPALSGACRGPGDVKINGKYSNTAGASGAQLTQEECAAECTAEPTCVGYAHSTAWCVVYGPGIDETPGADWTSDTHTYDGVVTGTKV